MFNGGDLQTDTEEIHKGFKGIELDWNEIETIENEKRLLTSHTFMGDKQVQKATYLQRQVISYGKGKMT